MNTTAAQPPDHISPGLTFDTTLGVSYPTRAVIWVGTISFEASTAQDWRAALGRAGMSGGTVLIPDNGTPPEAWCEADLRMARLVVCSCGEGNLDPESADAFGCLLCTRCFEEAGWDNAHNDGDHEATPAPGCPICRQADQPPDRSPDSENPGRTK
jgi:hypothetical protein